MSFEVKVGKAVRSRILPRGTDAREWWATDGSSPSPLVGLAIPRKGG